MSNTKSQGLSLTEIVLQTFSDLDWDIEGGIYTYNNNKSHNYFKKYKMSLGTSDGGGSGGDGGDGGSGGDGGDGGSGGSTGSGSSADGGACAGGDSCTGGDSGGSTASSGSGDRK